ncbi:MAG: hypothetical protein SV760_01130, partial [Halobacteria archaeon]|nr:hypothetical protein [Halobacteria archaeon]
MVTATEVREKVRESEPSHWIRNEVSTVVSTDDDREVSWTYSDDVRVRIERGERHSDDYVEEWEAAGLLAIEME